MIDKSRLEAKAAACGIALSGTQLDQLDRYAEVLVEYNQKVNLTAITDPEGIEDKHFVDSLLFASQPQVAGRMWTWVPVQVSRVLWQRFTSRIWT